MNRRECATCDTVCFEEEGAKRCQQCEDNWLCEDHKQSPCPMCEAENADEMEDFARRIGHSAECYAADE